MGCTAHAAALPFPSLPFPSLPSPPLPTQDDSKTSIGMTSRPKTSRQPREQFVSRSHHAWGLSTSTDLLPTIPAVCVQKGPHASYTVVFIPGGSLEDVLPCRVGPVLWVRHRQRVLLAPQGSPQPLCHVALLLPSPDSIDHRPCVRTLNYEKQSLKSEKRGKPRKEEDDNNNKNNNINNMEGEELRN